MSFKYNDEGIRTEKIVNGVSTKYNVVDGKVTFETNGTDSIYYSYDSEDNLVGMSLNGTVYWYVRNSQGDIIGIIDSTGTQVVSYNYDTWGKLVSITGTLASTVGQKNPYRYRGYRYDTETGLYYLQSRYYNPEWGRFINADDINYSVPGLLLTYNLYVYCLNNPVNHDDPDGNVIPLVAAAVATAPSWVPVVAGVSTAVISGITVGTMVNQARKNTKQDPYARPNQKKQGRERKEAKKGDDKNWKPNPNKRIKPLNKHSPSKKGHRKY